MVDPDTRILQQTRNVGDLTLIGEVVPRSCARERRSICQVLRWDSTLSDVSYQPIPVTRTGMLVTILSAN